MAGLGDIINLLTQRNADQRVDPSGFFGGSEEGQFGAGLAPDFLKAAAGLGGGGLGEFFANAFSQLGDKRALNSQLNTIGQQTSSRARTARTSGRFKGSPIGEALASGIETGGQAMEQQARLQDRDQQNRLGLALSQGFTGAVTNPLLSVLGIGVGGQQSQQSLEESRRQFNKSQPSGFDKFLGFTSGLFCWVAREVLGDSRWLAAREFMLHEASDYTKQLYWNHGEELAERVANEPKLRKELTPVFEEFARRGAKYLEA